VALGCVSATSMKRESRPKKADGMLYEAGVFRAQGSTVGRVALGCVLSKA
jgi:hypothetical protein